MNADGTNQTRLTTNAVFDGQPAFSPDGTRIAFTSNRDGNTEIYIMNANGTNQTRLTNTSPFSDSEPAFSPDGERIVFTSNRDSGNEIYVMDADGSDVTRLTNNAFSDEQPTFSSDGLRIAFTSYRDEAETFRPEIYVMNSDGTGQTRLTNNDFTDQDPAFSPNSNRIAFISTRDGGSDANFYELYLMDGDGGNAVRLTNNTGREEEPSWAGFPPTQSPSPTPTVSPTPNPTPEPTASPTPQPTATASPSPSPLASPTPTPTPTPAPSASPSASPTPAPESRQLLNIATRLRVQAGENVLIGGVIVTGDEPKKVIIRAIGPSLAGVFDGALADPVLDLYQGDTLLASNDNWRDTQQAQIEDTTIPPGHELESAIVYTLDPGFYTAIMSGKDGGTGNGVVEVYDLAQDANSKLANIATRGFVEAGDDVMIGGLIVGGNGTEDARVLLRAIGPSLANAGIADALRDPMLQLYDNNGELVRENDNWQETQQADIEATTIPPSDPAESAIVATLPPGNYTAVLRGKNDGIGLGLVEVYNVE